MKKVLSDVDQINFWVNGLFCILQLAVCIPVPTESIDRSTAGLESDRIYPGRMGEDSSQTGQYSSESTTQLV